MEDFDQNEPPYNRVFSVMKLLVMVVTYFLKIEKHNTFSFPIYEGHVTEWYLDFQISKFPLKVRLHILSASR